MQLRFAQPLWLEEVQLSWGTAVSVDIAVSLAYLWSFMAVLVTAQLFSPAASVNLWVCMS